MASVTHSDVDPAEPRWRRLTWGLLVYFALFIAHDIDHIVNESTLYELPTSFWVLLPIQYGFGLWLLALVLRRDRLSPVVSGALGIIATFGFVVVHALPFSFASYADTDAQTINWLLVFVPAAAASYVAVASFQLHSALRLPVRTRLTPDRPRS